ncbi:hypothetical protein WNY51_17250 [Pseudocolwellia sp. AS88]|jgi:hypothetical protein|uniref:hypothetical protein n=1 Tax=Pseudocolwellia sp. AS88 TaxID=3063958 RepID=UPI0026EA9884|nr:hypothetical protein [Pseudocolwellia sp. AS88]MDO7085373.1 hypothetical protein [Pseudocolwellia sp. AS88]
MKSESEKLIKKHHELIHTDNLKVISHVQREEDDWFINTLMFENIDVPFKYKRKQLYKSLINNRVNVTYYVSKEEVAGFEIEIMNIVRIKVS